MHYTREIHEERSLLSPTSSSSFTSPSSPRVKRSTQLVAVMEALCITLVLCRILAWRFELGETVRVRCVDRYAVGRGLSPHPPATTASMIGLFFEKVGACWSVHRRSENRTRSTGLMPHSTLLAIRNCYHGWRSSCSSPPALSTSCSARRYMPGARFCGVVWREGMVSLAENSPGLLHAIGMPP